MKKLLVTFLFISTFFFFVGCSLWTNDTSTEIKSELQNDLSKEDLKDLKIQQLVELKTGDTFELKQSFTGSIYVMASRDEVEKVSNLNLRIGESEFEKVSKILVKISILESKVKRISPLKGSK